MCSDDPEKLFTSGWAFKLPKMNCKELFFEDCVTELAELKKATHSFSFLKTETNEYKCLFTDFGEEEFIMFCILVNRHVALYNFLKLVILDTEKMRATPSVDHDFTYKALEYIKLKKLTNQTLD